MPSEPDLFNGLLEDSRVARERANQACQASAVAISRSERLRALFDAVSAMRGAGSSRPRGFPATDRARPAATVDIAPPIAPVATMEVEPAAPPAPDVATQKRTRARRQTREAHFAVASIAIDDEPWEVRYASLDVYHRGPDFDDVTAALWEVHCTTLPGEMRPVVREEYSLTIEARNGRRFAGRVFTQHASTELCTFLDVGEPLEGLCAADYLE